MRFRTGIVAGLFLAGCASAPPPSDPAAFSREAAMEMTRDLSRDSLFGRLPGSEGSETARQLIEARMAALGLEPLGQEGYRQSFTYGDFADRPGGEAGEKQTGINLIARIEGRSDARRTLVVTAHYDHVGVREGEIYNGADDNASGVAALLAVAEYFTKAPPRHDVIFAALDAEETGFHGARALLQQPPVPLDAITLNLNLDMVARGDNGILWASGTSHWPQLIPLVEEIAATAPVTLEMGFDTGDGRDDWTGLSDQAVFHRAGIPHLYLAVEDHEDYHTPRDDFARIDQDWFARSIETIVMVAAELDSELGRLFED